MSAAATAGETTNLLKNIDSSPGLVSLSARSLSFSAIHGGSIKPKYKAALSAHSLRPY